MTTHTIPEELFHYSAWANSKLFRLCESLTDEQLDQHREMGFGSLRNTLFHILAAEEIWYERWTLAPSRPIPTDAAGMSIREIELRLQHLDQQRRELMQTEQSNQYCRVIEYRDAKGNPWSNPLLELVMQVLNHGVHHRAQALNYLRSFGQTLPGGIDYIFWRFAHPIIRQEEATRSAMQQYGLELESSTGALVPFDARIIEPYFAYGDWANRCLLDLAGQLDDQGLDHVFPVGLGTIRKTLLHILDAERWWISNWTHGPSAFSHSPETTSLASLRSQWSEVISQRSDFLTQQSVATTDRIVTALVGSMPVRVMVIESLIQLCTHGTHHRAQLINMLRHSGLKPSGIDYIVWLRSQT